MRRVLVLLAVVGCWCAAGCGSSTPTETAPPTDKAGKAPYVDRHAPTPAPSSD